MWSQTSGNKMPTATTTPAASHHGALLPHVPCTHPQSHENGGDPNQAVGRRHNHIQNAFRKLVKDTGLSGSFYMLRKTGANLVKEASSKEVAQLWLAHKTAEGQTSQSIADKHYLTKGSYAGLDKAILAVEKTLKGKGVL